MTTPVSVEKNQHIILFDGVCNLCSAWVSFVYKRDNPGLFKFSTVQSEVGKEILIWCGLSIDTFETMVYIETGQAHFKSTAFFKIANKLGAPWPALSAIGISIPKPIRDWLYDRIALNRYRLFGQKSACLVPSGDLAARFL